jgi:hypothetical protein
MEETFQEVRAAPKVRDTEAMVREEGHPTHRPGAVESFSVVTLLTHQRMQQRVASNVRRSAWYNKAHPTFSDALALVGRQLWTQTIFAGIVGYRHGKSPSGATQQVG